jgi:hypothetical protein
VLARLKPVAFVDDHLKMLAQARGVPHRVWVDHGLEAETDEEGRRLVDHVDVIRVAGLLEWAEQFVEIIH